ncbi:hypothetical protein D3C86_1943020 [compost metagenome]
MTFPDAAPLTGVPKATATSRPLWNCIWSFSAGALLDAFLSSFTIACLLMTFPRLSFSSAMCDAFSIFEGSTFGGIGFFLIPKLEEI